MKQPQVTIYGRTGCHLCENLVNSLRPLAEPMNFILDLQQIDGNQELEALYGQLIPVVQIDGKYFSHFTINIEDFKSFLEKHRQHR